MKYIDLFDDGADFFSLFPLFKVMEPFKSVYKADRSKNKHQTNKLMWSLVLCHDLDSNLYSISNETERLEEAMSIMNFKISDVFDTEEDFLTYQNAFLQAIDTVLSADIRNKEDKLKERAEFIRGTKYTLDHMEIIGGKPCIVRGTASQLDKMIADTGKIHDEIRILRSKLRDSDITSGKGGAEESFSETL